MRRINTGTVGRPLLARLVSVDNKLSSLVPNENITIEPNGSGDVVIPAKWKFGQVSDDYTLYPMWFQAFWKTQDYTYTPDCVPIAKSLTDRFIDEIVPDDYILVRSMASANSFGQDGDIHTDWPRAEESVTGVVYTTIRWERSLTPKADCNQF